MIDTNHQWRVLSHRWFLVGLVLTLSFAMVAGFAYLYHSTVVASKITKQQTDNFDHGQVTQSPSVPIESPRSEVTVLFGGDMMFDRNIRQAIQRSGKDHIFSRMQPFISQHDLVVANLEGPVTDNESVSLGSIVGSRENFIFTFEPLVPQLLHDANIKVVNLGNNHINNFGSDGVQQTKERLTAASISYFGNITGEDTEDSVVEQTIGDVRFGFVNFNQFAPRSLEVALADIASLGDKVDFIIVYTHWGNEYELTINEVLRQQAQAMIDAGADMIIGSHPHVIQPSEVYKGKYIYYSLGNFVFDQYFDENVQTGLLLSVAFSSIDGSIKPIEHRIHLEKGGQTILLEP